MGENVDAATATWFEDECGNRCSVEHFGDAATARAALASLYRCRDCENCSDCAYCYDCVRCVSCVNTCDSTDCRDCSDCKRCTELIRAYGELDTTGGHDLTRGGLRPPAVPVLADIHQQVYEAARAPGALIMCDWHMCDTTHCRAGWVLALAGDTGDRLEAAYGPALAARLIYRASSPLQVPLARFYDDEAAALADMARLAALEAAANPLGDTACTHTTEV